MDQMQMITAIEAHNVKTLREDFKRVPVKVELPEGMTLDVTGIEVRTDAHGNTFFAVLTA